MLNNSVGPGMMWKLLALRGAAFVIVAELATMGAPFRSIHIELDAVVLVCLAGVCLYDAAGSACGVNIR